DPATGEVTEAEFAAMAGDDHVGSPDGMHFGSIRALRQDGSRVYLRFAGEQHDAELHLEGSEIASRVYAALDFLRRQCDPAAATGVCQKTGVRVQFLPDAARGYRCTGREIAL